MNITCIYYAKAAILFLLVIMKHQRATVGV